MPPEANQKESWKELVSVLLLFIVLHMQIPEFYCSS